MSRLKLVSALLAVAVAAVAALLLVVDHQQRPTVPQATFGAVRAFWSRHHPGETFPSLTSYETTLLSDVVVPDQIAVSFDHIGGLERVREEVAHNVLMPMRYPHLFWNEHDVLGVLRPARGILLHGPPGTGKTMLAKAIAREAGAFFINVSLSSIENKWFGESNKLLDALFSLSDKLAPCVVFFDEIDGLAKTRSESDQNHTASLKAQLLAAMDGVATRPRPVVFIGATNRVDDIDKGVLRRLRRHIEVGLPNERERADILAKTVARLAPGVDLARLAKLTDGFSGNDLNELCRAAHASRMQCYFRERLGVDAMGAACGAAAKVDCAKLPPMDDAAFEEALRKLREQTAS